ncbi:flagellar hook-basal body complex subunit FliE [Ammonifex degensii KC4]|uniref:Flagellar hook-basal body complex protein FliE n=1 Tax=Ammonifex degensii (strain DSM 10501 / KC4) TaxID=429009 RepID=C9R9Z4_AMMDK|nr:flagellar hook-basal body complex protein FliE [Ammonifex degensii]ACX53123.1 flagellar hook-basal body complex subunit FliE [Ammonifex degensii KC4]
MAVTPVGSSPGAGVFPESRSPKGSSFSDYLNQFLDRLERARAEADTALRDFLTGKAELHTVMIAAQEARLWLELAVQLRNKLVEAYQEISRMQI